MNSQPTNSTPTRLFSCRSGASEMTELTRAFDWSTTSVGPMEQWPQSLLTTVNTLLNSKFPMFLWWGDDLVQFYNDAYRPSLGNHGKHPAALGQQGKDCWEEIWPVIKPLIDQVYLTGESTWSEDQLIPIYRNGVLEDVYWTFSYSPVIKENGKVGGVLVVCQETTTHYQALQKISYSEQRFQNLVQNASVGIIVLAGENSLVEVINNACSKLIGRSAAEVAGKPLFKVIPELEEEFRPILEKVRTTGKPLFLYDHPYTVFVDDARKDGYLNLIYQPFIDAEGETTGVIVLAHDVTEQVLSLKKIKESSQDFINLTNAMPQIVWTAEPDGRVTYYNNRVEAFKGAVKEADGSWSWQGVLHEADIAPTIQAWDEAVANGKVYSMEHRVKMLEGEYRWHLSRALPFKDSQGRVLKWYGTATDVHEQKKNEEALAQSNKQLLRINEDLDNFIYTASHDLRAPIANIEGLLLLLMDNFQNTTVENDDSFEILEKMGHSVNRFKQTINALTDVVKLQQEFGDAPVAVSLTKVVADVVLDLTDLIKSTDTHLEVDVSACPTIRFSEKNLRSVVYNFLSNAIKYRAPDRPTCVSIRCESTPDWQVLVVQDNGLGIDLKRKDDLFTMFKRFHDHVEGTGIGLYMVKKMVLNAGGHIDVETKVNVGTTFRVCFPKLTF